MKKILVLCVLSSLMIVGSALAEESKTQYTGSPVQQTVTSSPKVDTGDTTWVLISTALVMLMTPGLVAITPASGFVGPVSSILIESAAGVLCYAAINLKAKLGYDDSLDVVGVHGVGGTWGAIAIGLFASKAVNMAGADGLLFGNASLLGIQALSVVAAWTYSFGVTLMILKVLDWTMGLRVSEDHEVSGLDLSQHGETGYSL